MTKRVLSWECKSGSQLNISKFYNINLYKEGNNIIIFIYAEKSFDKVKHPVLINSLRKLKIETFFFISWRLITLQYCSGFCHTLTRISHGFTCIPHPHPPSHLPLHLIPLGLSSAPGLSTCLMHPTWAGDLFHPR